VKENFPEKSVGDASGGGKVKEIHWSGAQDVRELKEATKGSNELKCFLFNRGGKSWYWHLTRAAMREDRGWNVGKGYSHHKMRGGGWQFTKKRLNRSESAEKAVANPYKSKERETF